MALGGAGWLHDPAGGLQTSKPNFSGGNDMARWTDELKARQAEKIRDWQPWKHSTGAKTEAGKQISSRNGYKGGHRNILRQVIRDRREQAAKLRSEIEASIGKHRIKQSDRVLIGQVADHMMATTADLDNMLDDLLAEAQR